MANALAGLVFLVIPSKRDGNSVLARRYSPASSIPVIVADVEGLAISSGRWVGKAIAYPAVRISGARPVSNEGECETGNKRPMRLWQREKIQEMLP